MKSVGKGLEFKILESGVSVRNMCDCIVSLGHHGVCNRPNPAAQTYDEINCQTVTPDEI